MHGVTELQKFAYVAQTRLLKLHLGNKQELLITPTLGEGATVFQSRTRSNRGFLTWYLIGTLAASLHKKRGGSY